MSKIHKIRILDLHVSGVMGPEANSCRGPEFIVTPLQCSSFIGWAD